MRREPKKSETIEVRVPYETKQAFMAACQARGTTASSVLRGFIDRYVASSASALPFARRRRRLAAIVSGGGLAAAAALAAVAVPAHAATDPRLQAVFEWMDANHDAQLSAAEFISPQQDSGPPAGLEVLVDSKVPPPLNESRAALFQRLDSDHDGSLSLAELSSGSLVRTVATPAIAAADSNHDGAITEGELAAFMTARRAAAGSPNPSAGVALMAHGVIAAADGRHEGKVMIADLER